jgi:hypothetical protein
MTLSQLNRLQTNQVSLQNASQNLRDLAQEMKDEEASLWIYRAVSAANTADRDIDVAIREHRRGAERAVVERVEVVSWE